MEMEFESEIIGQDILEKLIPTLGNGNNARNLSVWAEREYGERTLQDIAEEFGISSGRVRQIHLTYSTRVAKFLEEAA